MKHTICWILLLQLVNVSVDHVDHRQSSSSAAGKEGSTTDEIESIYEWLAEGVYDTDVPESDDEEIDSTSKSIELYFFPKITGKLPMQVALIDHHSHYQDHSCPVYKEPKSPPPKVA